MSETFTCANCGGTFEKAWSDEEARAESEAFFGPVPEEERAVVCDNCHQKMMAWLRGMAPPAEPALACPGCGAQDRWIGGPQGGFAVNMGCGACGRWWNVLLHDLIAPQVLHPLPAAPPPEVWRTTPGPIGQLRAKLAYHDPTFQPRRCNHCDASYSGPAVYCSWECSNADA